jgi:hypothetical protein
MNTKPCLLIAGLSLLAGAAFASDPAGYRPARTDPAKASPVFRQPTSPPAPVDTAAPNAPAPPRISSQPLSSRQYQTLNQGVVTPALAERRALYQKDVGPRLRVNAIGAPVSPMMGETRSEQGQARVPLLSLTW